MHKVTFIVIIFHTFAFLNSDKSNIMPSKKRERFEKVASNRVQKVIDFLGLIGNCSNKNNYEYTERDVELMFKEINRAVKEAKVMYDKELNKTKTGFKF